MIRITRDSVWVPWLVLAVFAPSLQSCVRASEADLVETFDCEDNCGWSLLNGDSDSAQFIETVPGERGFRLQGAEVEVLKRFPAIPTGNPPVATISGQCVEGTDIELDILSESETSALVLFRSVLALQPRWTFRSVQVATAETWVRPEPADSIILRLTNGSGPCELDHFEIEF